jgi:adenylate cyclase
MAFWGWPEADADQGWKAVRAASAIWAKFDDLRAMAVAEDLRGLGFGIGIAHGPAVAGKLGSPRQYKVDVVGPTVNRAARLEGLTKVFGVPVVLDGPAADSVLAQAADRFRALGWVRPYGLREPVRLCALHTRPGDPVEETTRFRGRRYEAGLKLFERGDWAGARAELAKVRDVDPPARFLAALIGDHDGPPDGPDGRPWPRWPDGPDGTCVIPVESK